MQTQSKRDRADAALAEILTMFESGSMPEAIVQTRIARARHDRPMCEWSLGNQLLAFFHSTEDARGYRQWQATGRHVKKGARAFGILGPVTVKRAETNPETGEETERRAVVGFKALPVFRIEDTDGELIN